MNILFKNAFLPENDGLAIKNILVENGVITAIQSDLKPNSIIKTVVYDLFGNVVLPAAIDVHTHLREPGFEWKGTIATETKSAVKGGFGAVMAMPNLIPCPDCKENLLSQLSLINNTAHCDVYPYASVTKGEKGQELSAILELKNLVRAFSDDGVCVNDLRLLEEAMLLAKEYDFVISSHSEARGISEDESEFVAVERELELVEKTKCAYHFCHLSQKRSFDLVRKAKKTLNVSAEVTPHHLFLNNENVGSEANFKMNPPLRSKADMLATQEALLDGTANIIATDHAPHSFEEKSKPYSLAPNGIIGLETALPLVYTHLVKTKIASFSQMSAWFTANPSKRFSLPEFKVAVGEKACFTALNVVSPHIYNKNEILSKSSNSPFIGSELFGFPTLTVLYGDIKYEKTV